MHISESASSENQELGAGDAAALAAASRRSRSHRLTACHSFMGDNPARTARILSSRRMDAASGRADKGSLAIGELSKADQGPAAPAPAVNGPRRIRSDSEVLMGARAILAFRGAIQDLSASSALESSRSVRGTSGAVSL